jgi:hypothetical protein
MGEGTAGNATQASCWSTQRGRQPGQLGLHCQVESSPGLGARSERLKDVNWDSGACAAADRQSCGSTHPSKGRKAKIGEGGGWGRGEEGQDGVRIRRGP